MAKRKLILWVAVICLLAVLIPGTALAATEGWNKNDDGTWSYYQDGQWLNNTVCQINGKYYGFDTTSRMYENKWVKDNGRWYYFGEGGAAYRNGVYWIDGAYYGFNYEGQMYADCAFGTRASPEPLSDYRAKANGVLYRNEWYNDNGNWCYYGDNALKCMDRVLLIGGQYYGFNSSGYMYKDRVFSAYDEASGNWVEYCAKADGTLYKNTWRQGADGKWLYLGADGAAYRNGVYSIGGKYYGFDHLSEMYNDCAFKQKDCYYRAKAGGVLYQSEWYQMEDGTWYYYGSDCAGGEDFVKVGNTWYFFRQGRMITDELVHAKNGAYYYIYNRGQSYVALPATGWFQMNGAYYYHNGGGELVKNKVVSIGSKYYGFAEEGRMYAGESFTIEFRSNYGGWKAKYYRAKTDGSLYVNTWYEDAYDQWFYYGADGAAAEGYTKVDNAWYYFDYDGSMYTSDCGYVDGTYYAFGADGKQITAQGKQNIGGRYVYVKKDSTIARNEWISIDGKWYYFNPQMLANDLAWIDGQLYAVDNAGVCVKVTGNGIYNIGADGEAYIENGEIFEGWKQLNGSWYYFGPYMYANMIGTINGVHYVFDQNGKLFTGGWILLGDFNNGECDRRYAYADASGKAAVGVQTIGGSKYVFSSIGYMYTDTSVTVNGVIYVIDKNGRVISDTNTDGWKQVDDKYYYVKNGKLVTSTILEIGNKRYAFDYNGVMASDDIHWTYVGFNYTGVLAGADGALKTNGWYQHKGYWYYADANGYLLEGKRTIGGKTYILDSYLKIGTFWWNGKIVTTNAGGSVISEKDPADGWSYVDGTVYYYKNGLPYNGWVGDYLILDGVMAIDDWFNWKDDWYAFDAYGRYVKSGWHRFNYGAGHYSDYVYAKPGGKLCFNEWLQLGSKRYYFDGVYMVSDGTYEVDGQMCKFDANGVYLGKEAVSGDGWKQIGSDWFYYHAGAPVSGLQHINGKRYIFDENGALLSKGFNWFEETYELFASYLYYIDSNGAIPDYTGWKMIGGRWCYFNSDNMPVVGWFQADGKEYFAEIKQEDGIISVGIVTGYRYIDGRLYYFGSDGACLGTKGVSNGWFQAGGQWYYFRNSTALTDYQTIDGKGYYFLDGVMVTDEIVGDRYFDSNGVHRTAAGWYETSEGWIYVDADGALVNGVQKIGGKEYYFSGYVMVR